MRPRTFILLTLVLVIGAIAVLLILANRNGGVTNLLGGGATGGDDGVPQTVDGGSVSGDDGSAQILVTPSPEPQFRRVVISRVRIPVGTQLLSEYLSTEERPITNIALQGGYTFTDTKPLIGQITRVEVARGQEILAPMLATDPTNVGSFGSDLALHIPTNQVAVAFPITDLSGVAWAMRPGDLVDVLMTVRTVEIDPEFRSPLPNKIGLINESALLDGQEFLFDAVAQGRLEFISELNQVALIIPKGTGGSEATAGFDPIPKRVTQLSIQQAEVLYVGIYQDPRELDRQQEKAQEAAAAAAAAADPDSPPVPTPTPIPSRLDQEPNIVILSMTIQDALALKWAREQKVDIDLVLRSPGDNTVFATTSVSLPQIIDQGALSIPEPINFDLAISNE